MKRARKYLCIVHRFLGDKPCPLCPLLPRRSLGEGGSILDIGNGAPIVFAAMLLAIFVLRLCAG